VRVTRESSFYETEPVDFLEQAWFLNCAVEGETKVPARIVASPAWNRIANGEQKLVAKGPRLIDMDILLYGAEMIDAPDCRCRIRGCICADSCWCRWRKLRRGRRTRV